MTDQQLKSSPIGILGAMDAEIDGYLRLMRDIREDHWRGFTFFSGTLFETRVVTAKSGVGKVLSAVITQRVIDQFAPSHLLFTGIAGALNPKYQIGDLVLGVDAVQHDLDASAVGFPLGQIPYTEHRFIRGCENLLHHASSCPELTIHRGRVLTGDQFLTHAGRDSHAYLIEELNGDVIEMEGASVAFVCHLNEIPFLIARTISDKANGEAPEDFLRFLPRASENSVKLVQHLLTNLRNRS